jgi:hypothetical protein
MSVYRHDLDDSSSSLASVSFSSFISFLFRLFRIEICIQVQVTSVITYTRYIKAGKSLTSKRESGKNKNKNKAMSSY